MCRQSSGHRRKQFWHVVMVDHKVRHLKQSFVALKISVRIEMISALSLRESPPLPAANGRIIEVPSSRQTPFGALFQFPEKIRATLPLPAGCGIRVFGTIPWLLSEFLE
jgi:hypothetical protein